MRRRPKIGVRNTILMTILVLISIPGFILYQIFKNRYLYWRDIKPMRFILSMYYAVVGRIVNVIVKDAPYI